MLRGLYYASFVFWFIGTPAALWFVIRPVRRWALVANRHRAALLLLGVFVISPIAGTLAAEADPTERAEFAKMDTERDSPAAHTATAQRQARRHPERFIGISAYEAPTMSGLNSYVVMSGKVTNNAPIAVRDPVITCDLLGASGSRVSTVQETLFQTLAAGQTFDLDQFQMGLADEQWQTADCRATSAVALN